MPSAKILPFRTREIYDAEQLQRWLDVVAASEENIQQVYECYYTSILPSIQRQFQLLQRTGYWNQQAQVVSELIVKNFYGLCALIANKGKGSLESTKGPQTCS